MRVGEAIQGVLEERHLSHNWLARHIDLSAASVSRLLRGQQGHFPVDLIAHIERVLDLPAGYLFRAAGLVECDDTRDAIASDPALTAIARRVILAAYDAAVTG